MLSYEIRRLLGTDIISFSVNLKSCWNWINKTDPISSERDTDAQKPFTEKFGKQSDVKSYSKRVMFGAKQCSVSL